MSGIVRVRYLLVALTAASLGVGDAGCSAGSYLWFSELPYEPSLHAEYVIGTGDVVSVRVYLHEDLNGRGAVRSDGKLALPLIGEIEARGKHPSELRTEIEARLKSYIVSPSALVNVDETRPITVSLLGEVARPGAYAVDANSSLAHVLAMAGGLTEYASRNQIFVVRQEPAPMRIRFTFRAITQDIGHAGEFPLHPGDVVVVE